MAVSTHERATVGKEEWLTPPRIINALGKFDLDPCAAIDSPWEIAKHSFNVFDNGLSKHWFGRVWLNPPYGNKTGEWIARMADHGNGIALVFARTETKMFFDSVWPVAHAVLFLEGRLTFHHHCGRMAKANSGAPSVLIAYGTDNTDILQSSGIQGKLVRLL